MRVTIEFVRYPNTPLMTWVDTRIVELPTIPQAGDIITFDEKHYEVSYRVFHANNEDFYVKAIEKGEKR